MTAINGFGTEKVCPFMSGQPVAVTVPKVIEHQNAQGVTTMMVSCVKQKCGLWGFDCCSLKQESLTSVLGNIAVGLVDVADGLKPFDAPLTGSPTTRLVEAIDRLVAVVNQFRVKKK